MNKTLETKGVKKLRERTHMIKFAYYKLLTIKIIPINIEIVAKKIETLNFSGTPI